MDPALPWLFAGLALAGILSWRLMAPDPPRPERIRISSSDPLLSAARARAQRTLGVLREHLTRNSARVLVKTRVEGTDHQYRGQWSTVVSHDADGLVLRPRGSCATYPLSWDEVEDWQLTLESGAVRGGFTVIATWRIRQRDSGAWPQDAQRQLERFLDA